MKFGRIVSHDSSTNDLRIVDLFTTDPSDVSTPMKIPAGADPLSWLEKMFEHQRAEWKATHAEFRKLPESVFLGARFVGDRANPRHVSDHAKYVDVGGATHLKTITTSDPATDAAPAKSSKTARVKVAKRPRATGAKSTRKR